MKVRITPIITRNEEGRIDLPVSTFHVVENGETTLARKVLLSDINNPTHSILADIND